MDLRGGLDEILQVRPVDNVRVSQWSEHGKKVSYKPRQEVTQIDELAVLLVLNVDDAPSVLTASHGLAVDDHALL